MKKINNWHQLFCQNITPLNKLKDYLGIELSVKRDDLNHEIIQGNKLRKLKYNLKSAIDDDYEYIATFGGAWSNHILATAKAASICGIKSIGFIRGDELENHEEKWSSTLKKAVMFGMELVFISRQEYRLKEGSVVVKKRLVQSGKNTYIIPEGGSNFLAVKGVMEVVDELVEQIKEPTHIVTACGTAGTLAGLIDGVAKHGWNTNIVGIPVLKGAEFLLKDVQNFSKFYSQVSWQLYCDYHAGGYAKINTETLTFAKLFTKKNNIKLDKIYTAKAFYATYDLINKGIISKGSRVVILHTGGLQGGVI